MAARTRGPVFVGSAFVAQYPAGGGNFWVPAQYVLGLRALGIEAYWLELLWTHDGARTAEFVSTFRAHVAELGLAPWTTLVVFPGDRDDPPGRPLEQHGMSADDLRARARDALLVNLANSVTAPLRTPFARTALFDLDPGPFQLWAREHDLGVGRHDVHLTIGRNLGAPDSPVPVGGVTWHRVWPAIHLASWPEQSDAPPAPYTTVTPWWTNQYAFLDGETYDCNKRPAFVEMIDLPRRVGVALELAANLHPGETDDRALLARHGWRLVDPAAVAGTPNAFRRYVQRSRGEFSCAKPAYVKARPGWVSDRTICYLASGRPCVVQATGAENHLPPSAGLRFFRSLDEAADAIAAVEADYATAARAARRLAADVFATDVVLPGLLAAAGA
jgi:hypothetical protein